VQLIHYRYVPRLAGEVFVDTNWILALVNGLIEQAHKQTVFSDTLIPHVIPTPTWPSLLPPPPPAW